MASLVTLHNDGPDDCEVRFGNRSLLVKAGGDLRLSTTVTVEILPLPAMTSTEMALHMGVPLPHGVGTPTQTPCRYAED